MRKFLRVIAYEYRRHVLRRSFLLALLSLPALILVSVGAGFLLVKMETDATPIGYIDHAGVVQRPLPQASISELDEPVQIIPFKDEMEALAALEKEEIQGYYIIPENYLQTTQVEEVFLDSSPSDNARAHFRALLRFNILADQSPQIVTRVVDGARIIIRSPDGERVASPDSWLSIVLPLVLGIVFFIVVMSSSGYLMQAVVDEKENRTMEVLITSVSPGQLIAGKIIALIGVGLTQLMVWIAFGALGMFIGGANFPALQEQFASISLGSMGLMGLALLPSYVMFAGLMAAMGAMVTDTREAQQMAGLLTLPIWIPYWLMVPLMKNPNGPIALTLSFFPLTAPLTLLCRLSFTIIPLWQLVLNFSVLFVSAVGAIWLAGKVFRMGMMRYGKRLRWKEIFSLAKKSKVINY